MNKVILIKSLKIVIPLILCFVAFSYSQNFEAGLKSANTTIWGYVRIILSTVCFFIAIWNVYQGAVGGQKDAWTRALIAIAFAIALSTFPAIYKAVTNQDVINTGTSTTP